METQKIANLLNDPDNKTSKFATRKWCIINNQNNGQYGKGAEDNDSTINETAENLDIVMPMYNLVECSDNYADSSGSLYQFKRDEFPINDAGNPLNVALDNSTSFKYKKSLLGKADDDDDDDDDDGDDDGSLKNAKIVVPLKYLSNFFSSLEVPLMPLINCKTHLELNWNNNCVMYGADAYAGGDNDNDRETKFQITSTKLDVPVVTLSTEDNKNLIKQLDEGFKRSVYWNECKSKIETKTADDNNVTRFPLDSSFQDVNRLFVLDFNNTTLPDGNDGPDRVKKRQKFTKSKYHQLQYIN